MSKRQAMHALLALTGASAAFTAKGLDSIEVSRDGLETSAARQFADRSATQTRGGAVPYGLTPDWSNTLRRQVGGLQVVDFNGDGKDDIFVGCYSSNSFPPYTDWRNFIHFNAGGLPEDIPSWISSDQVSTTDVRVGDINLDNFPDVFCATGLSSPNVIYFGSASGPSTSPGWFSAEPGSAFAVGALLVDIDHDDDLDVFTANQGLSQSDPYRPMFGFRNNNGVLSTTPFWQSAETSIQNSLAAGDYDGDGWEDIAVSKWANFQTAIYRNVNGTPATTPAWTTGNTTTDRGVAFSDIDGNGDLDLVVGKNPTTLYSNTDGMLTPTWFSGAPFFGHSELRFADIDRDGDDDLAEIHFSDGRAHIYLNEGGVLSTTPSWTYDAPVVGTALAFGDINGDGWLDLVLGYSGDPSVVVFLATPLLTPGDMNCDGFVSVSDIGPFVLAVTDPAGYAIQFPDCNIDNGDVNEDGNVTVGDIGPFVQLLTGG